MDFNQLIEHAPATGVLVFLVVYFMKYIRERDKDNEETSRLVAESNRELAQAIQENNRVIGANTEALRTNTKLCARATETLDQLQQERKAS